MTDKPIVNYHESVEQEFLAMWKRRAHQHRLEGCIECLAGDCITGAIKIKERGDEIRNGNE